MIRSANQRQMYRPGRAPIDGPAADAVQGHSGNSLRFDVVSSLVTNWPGLRSGPLSFSRAGASIRSRAFHVFRKLPQCIRQHQSEALHFRPSVLSQGAGLSSGSYGRC